MDNYDIVFDESDISRIDEMLDQIDKREPVKTPDRLLDCYHNGEAGAAAREYNRRLAENKHLQKSGKVNTGDIKRNERAIKENAEKIKGVLQERRAVVEKAFTKIEEHGSSEIHNTAYVEPGFRGTGLSGSLSERLKKAKNAAPSPIISSSPVSGFRISVR